MVATMMRGAPNDKQLFNSNLHKSSKSLDSDKTVITPNKSSTRTTTTSKDHHHHHQQGKETLMQLQQGVPNQDLECSMCGDVGFSSELFRCKKCLNRFQHTYCSRFYPNMVEDEVCEWCSLSPGEGNNPTSTSSTNNTSIMNKESLKIQVPKVLASNGVGNIHGAARKPGTAGTSYKNPPSNNSSGQYVDALELLLEVAQAVEDRNNKTTSTSVKRSGGPGGQVSKGRIQQQPIVKRQKLEDGKISRVLAPEVQKQEVKKVSGGQENELQKKMKQTVQDTQLKQVQDAEHKPMKQVQDDEHKQKLKKIQQKEQQIQQQKQQNQSEKKQKLQLSTSRSIGRRYKLLSDVLC